MIVLLISALVLPHLALSSTDICHVGISKERLRQHQCRHGGCTVLNYYNAAGIGVAEYKCLSDLHRHHPAFVTMACQSSTDIATCYDHNSDELVPINIRRLGARESTFGEVLRVAGIERFCCCRGDYCNYNNDQIDRHMHIDLSRADNFPPGLSSDHQPQNASVKATVVMPAILLISLLLVIA